MIKTLRLENFRCHKSTTLELSEFVALTGRHGAGKTSVLDALATLLVGKNRFTDARGAGLRDDIQVGTNSMSVSGSLNGHKLERRVTATTHSLRGEGLPTDVRVAQGMVLASLKVSDELIVTLLDARLFLDRTLSEQRQVLIKLLRPASIEVPEACKEVGIAEISGVEDIDRAIKRLKEESVRGVNRDLRNLEAEIGLMKAEPPNVPQLRLALINAQTALERAEKASRQTILRRDKLATMENLRQSLPKSVDPALGATANVLKAQQLAKEYQAESDEAATKFHSAVQKVEETKASLRACESQLQKLLGMGRRCGVIETITCPLEDKEKDSMRHSLENQMDGKRRAVDAAISDESKAKEELEAASKKSAKSRSALAEAQAAKSRIDEIRRLEGELAGMDYDEESESRLAAAKREVFEAQKAVAEGQALENEAQNRQLKIREVEQKRQQVAKYENALST